MDRLISKLPWVKKKPEPVPEEEDDSCCEGVVHIAYRGISDDRLYLAENRRWNDVRFFRPNGLRVFCAGCRRRLY